MAVIGIICEYNPFHNGHAKQLRLIREAYGGDTVIVCLMSGNYVQRGEPALFEKAVRARAAVVCGADLVLELPLTYALRSAEGFADGGVEIFDRLGLDTLCFGSESGDAELLMRTAQALLTPEFAEALHSALSSGVSFAAAREAALSSLADASALRNPNDILAVEYCKALLRRGSRISPFVLLREGDYDSSDDPQNPSASRLRERSAADPSWLDAVPPEAAMLYMNSPRYTLHAGERAVLARVRTLADASFEALPFGSEGLWRKLMQACRTEASVEEIVSAVKSKRYARSRIQRMLLCAYLGLSAQDLSRSAPYVRVLAFNDAGRETLRRWKDRALPLVNAGAVPPDAAYYAAERTAADLYTLFCEDERGLICGFEQKNRIFYQDLEKSSCKMKPTVLS